MTGANYWRTLPQSAPCSTGCCITDMCSSAAPAVGSPRRRPEWRNETPGQGSRLPQPDSPENASVWNVAANLTAQWAFVDDLQKGPLPVSIGLGPFRIPVLYVFIGKPVTACLADKARIVILWSPHKQSG